MYVGVYVKVVLYVVIFYDVGKRSGCGDVLFVC